MQRCASAWVFTVAVAGCSGNARDAAATLPNIILISIDTLRADHVSSYGYERETTPEIDAFFESASIFENAMSTSPCTRPSVRQYLSGAFWVDPKGPRLAEHLRAAGYQTAAVVSQQLFYENLESDYKPGFESFDIQSEQELDAYGAGN